MKTEEQIVAEFKQKGKRNPFHTSYSVPDHHAYAPQPWHDCGHNVIVYSEMLANRRIAENLTDEEILDAIITNISSTDLRKEIYTLIRFKDAVIRAEQEQNAELTEFNAAREYQF